MKGKRKRQSLHQLPSQVTLHLPYAHIPFHSESRRHMYVRMSIITHKAIGSGNTLPIVMARYYGRQNSHTCVH